jgi:hypothetical protein
VSNAIDARRPEVSMAPAHNEPGEFIAVAITGRQQVAPDSGL